MSLITFLVLFAQTSAVLLVTFSATLFVKRNPAVRIAIYRVALLGVLALLATSYWSTHRSVPPFPVTLPTISVDSKSIPHVSRSKVVAASSDSTNQEVAYSPEEYAPTSGGVLNTLWIIGMTFLSLKLCFGYLRLSWIKRHSSLITDFRANNILTQVAEQLKVSPPAIRSTNDLPMPTLVGIFKPSIYLPSGWLSQATDEQVGALFSHEIGHLANNDLSWGLLYRILGIVVWPQPLFWFLGKRMFSTSEELSDSLVLNSGYGNTMYAELLLQFRDVASKKRELLIGIGVVSRRYSLSNRIRQILSEKSPNITFLSAWAKGFTALSAAALTLLAVYGFAQSQSLRNKSERGIPQTPLKRSSLSLGQMGSRCPPQRLIWLRAMGNL